MAIKLHAQLVVSVLLTSLAWPVYANDQASSSENLPAGDLPASVPAIQETATAGAPDNPGPVTTFQALSSAGRTSDALLFAERFVQHAADYDSETRTAMIESLIKSAGIRRSAGDLSAAMQITETAVDLTERQGGVFDPALIEPLVLMARLMQDNGDHPAAIKQLNRAQHIVHRTDGVMSTRQLPILARMINSYLSMRQRSNVNTIIEQAYAIVMRDVDENSLEAVPFIIGQARIKTWNGQFRQARELYYIALGILDQSLAVDGPDFIAALDGLASVRYAEQLQRGALVSLTGRSATSRTNFAETEILDNLEFRRYRFFGQRFVRSTPKRFPVPGRKEGTRALQKIISIMENHSDRYSAVQLAEAYIRLGDWFMIIRKPDRSIIPYRTGWNILSREEDARDLLASHFGQPKRLKYQKATPPTFGPGMYENYDGKYVEIRFAVNKHGAVRDLQLGNSNSPSAMNTRMRAAVKRAIFRPRYIDGKPVVTHDVFLREEFAGMLWWLASRNEN